MEAIGEKLRKARKEQNKTLADITRQTKISASQLRLLEEENFKFLPETYVKSFLRTYAVSLQLDADAIINEYNQMRQQEKTKQAEREEQAQAAAGESGNRLLEWSLGIAGLILLIGLILLYVSYKSTITNHHTGAIKPEEFENNHTTTPESPTPIARDGEDGGSLLNLQITATEEVWLKVTTDNRDIEEYTLVPGSSITLSANDRYEILVGNAGGIHLKYDDREVGKLGASGVPMRLVITDQGIIEKKITNIHRAYQ